MSQKPVRCESEELRHRALQGDPELVADLLLCFQDDLVRFLRRRCNNEDDALDATQDTFEAAIRYLEGYRGESSLKNWLYRLASTACIKMRRGQKNDPALHQSIDTPAGSHAMAGLGEEVEAMLTARLMPLQDALSQLSPQDRGVLLMRDGEGMSTLKTAEELGLTGAAVKSRLHRARKQMRAALEEL